MIAKERLCAVTFALTMMLMILKHCDIPVDFTYLSIHRHCLYDLRGPRCRIAPQDPIQSAAESEAKAA